MKKYIYLLLGVLFIALIAFFFRNHSQTSHQAKTQVSTSSEKVSSNQSSPPASADIISEEYRVARGEISLYGQLTAPASFRMEKRPLLAISHGFNNTLEMYEDYAQYFAKLGYVVYRFDFYGGSRRSKSGGTDMLNMSILTEQADLTAVLDQLSQEDFIDKDNVTLLGVSQGGVVSTLYAADKPDKVKKLLLIFPAFVLFDDVKETYDKLGVTSPEQVPATITHRNNQLSAIYLTDTLKIDIKEKMQAVKAPTLIVQGTDDEVVPYDYALSASQTIPQAQLVTVQNGRHWIDSSFNQVALPAMTDFLQQE